MDGIIQEPIIINESNKSTCNARLDQFCIINKGKAKGPELLSEDYSSH